MKDLKQTGEMQYFDFSFEPGKKLVERISIYKGAPLISAITVCNTNSNYEHIVQMMNSIKNQTFPYWEWIVIVKDKESPVVKIAKNDKRIKIIVDNYESVTKAKINAVKTSTSDLIFNFEENDLIDKTMFECGYFSMMFNNEARVCIFKNGGFWRKRVTGKSSFGYCYIKEEEYNISRCIYKKTKLFAIRYI